MHRTASRILKMGVFLCPLLSMAQTDSCDLVSPYTGPSAVDVQAAIEMSLGTRACPSTINIVGPGVCNVSMVQRVINAALGGPCSTPTSHSVTLTWTASASANVAGYNIYRATTSSGPYSKVNSTLVTTLAYEDTVVQAGITYYYVVTAVNTSNQESGYSIQVQGKVPTP